MEPMYSSGDLYTDSKVKKPPTIDIPLEPINHVQSEPDKAINCAPSPPTPNAKNCLCSPTTHAGSFRCRLHRSLQKQWSMGSNSSRMPSSPPEEAPSNGTTIPNTVETQ